MTEQWTIIKVLDWTTGRFERAQLESPRLDAQVLLAHVLQCPRLSLYTDFDRPLSPKELETYRALIQRRLAREPVAYLVGEKEFWSLKFRVNASVLVPRPDTETLVQLALELGDAMEESEIAVAEIGTGSGAITIAVSHERPNWTMLATDLSPEALQIARDNAEHNRVADRIVYLQGDLLAPLTGQRFSLLLANLPYIGRAEMLELSADVLTEPTMALLGGETGLELIANLIAGAQTVLRPGGWVVLEHGFAQGPQVQELARAAGFTEVQTRSDLAGRARVTYFRASSK